MSRTLSRIGRSRCAAEERRRPALLVVVLGRSLWVVEVGQLVRSINNVTRDPRSQDSSVDLLRVVVNVSSFGIVLDQIRYRKKKVGFNFFLDSSS